MRTDELVALLASDAQPVQPGHAGRRMLAWLALGPVGAVLLMLLLLGPRPDLAVAMTWPMFWVKVLWPACVAVAGCVLLSRLGHPGTRVGASPVAALAPTALIIAGGAFVLWQAPGSERVALLLGQTWFECPFLIALLAVPAFIVAMRALRGLAPTRLRLAGAAAGLFAGAAGAFGYAFHCPELQPPFLAVWYVLGMFIPVAVGALLGPRLLRW